ncbi:MAG TPA: 30S ribosomal protein S20 [Vicinamibacterales bacterium]|nr:30S ribosomal protein S20 [Vicinamibacterales bacterium]
MANHKSALKAHRQNVKNREANRQQRSRLRTALKNARGAVKAGKNEGLAETVSLIDKMAAKGIIHDNTAARYKSRLARQAAKA